MTTREDLRKAREEALAALEAVDAEADVAALVKATEKASNAAHDLYRLARRVEDGL